MLLTLHIFRKKIHLFGILPLILMLLLIGGGVLEAEGLPYVIGSVILNIEGKTNSHLLQNEMDLFPYDEHFETKEALVSRAEERKSFLFNKRIFDSFRSYPFCATAGVNLKDVVDVFKGIKQLDQIEFEVLLSLSMFY